MPGSDGGGPIPPPGTCLSTTPPARYGRSSQRTLNEIGLRRSSDQPETCYGPCVETPVGQLMNIVVDCPDADISARFWAAVLGWERVQEDAGSVDIADASDSQRRLVFQQIADYRPPGWPNQGPPQQLHLDVRVGALEIADQRGRALGAVPLGARVVLEDETYRVYADPAGHPFCLVQLETT